MTLIDKYVADAKGIVAVTLRTLGSRKRHLIVAIPVAIAVAIYGLNRGIFVGSVDYVIGEKLFQKKCRYLFVTGVSEIPARGSVFDAIPAPEAQGFRGMYTTDRRSDNLYCRVFGD
jgi:hypothetical protein